MGIEFDAMTGRRSLCVFDAAKIRRGPLCKLHLKHRLPWGIHSEWVEGLEIAEPDLVAVKVREEEEDG
jgi:carotenoid cleavage dioxygenase-like enzyme